jgi:hypothetical protein
MQVLRIHVYTIHILIINLRTKILTSVFNYHNSRIYKGVVDIYTYIGRFIMLSVITNIYNKKTKGPVLMELFTAT